MLLIKLSSKLNLRHSLLSLICLLLISQARAQSPGVKVTSVTPQAVHSSDTVKIRGSFPWKASDKVLVLIGRRLCQPIIADTGTLTFLGAAISGNTEVVVLDTIHRVQYNTGVWLSLSAPVNVNFLMSDSTLRGEKLIQKKVYALNFWIEDVNRNGKQEMVTWSTNGDSFYFRELYPSVTGVSVKTQRSKAPARIVRPFYGDLNHDGYPEIAGFRDSDSTLNILLNSSNDSTCKFSRTDSIKLPLATNGADEIRFADINQDRRQDLIYSSPGYKKTYFWKNSLSGGNFTLTPFDTLNGPHAVKYAGFVNKDTFADLITAYGKKADTLAVVIRTPGRTYNRFSKVSFLKLDSATILSVHVTALTKTLEKYIVVRTTKRTWICKWKDTLLTKVTYLSGSFTNTQHALGDINGDGLCDVMVIGSRGEYNVFLNISDTVVKFKKSAYVKTTTINTATNAEFGFPFMDLDADGESDLLLIYDAITYVPLKRNLFKTNLDRLHFEYKTTGDTLADSLTIIKTSDAPPRIHKIKSSTAIQFSLTPNGAPISFPFSHPSLKDTFKLYLRSPVPKNTKDTITLFDRENSVQQRILFTKDLYQPPKRILGNNLKAIKSGDTVVTYTENVDLSKGRIALVMDHYFCTITRRWKDSVEWIAPPAIHSSAIEIYLPDSNIHLTASQYLSGTFHKHDSVTRKTKWNSSWVKDEVRLKSHFYEIYQGDTFYRNMDMSNPVHSALHKLYCPNAGDSIEIFDNLKNITYIGDLNKDLHPDIIRNYGTEEAYIQLADTGYLKSAGLLRFVTADTIGYSWINSPVVVNDFDEDGTLELVTSYGEMFQISLISGILKCSKIPFKTGLEFDYSANLKFGSDIDGDGKMDLLLTRKNRDIVCHNISKKGYLRFEEIDLGPSSYSFAQIFPAIADFNLDQKPDYLFLTNKSFRIWQNQTVGNNIKFKEIVVLGGPYFFQSYDFGDLNGDTIPDLGISSWNKTYILTAKKTKDFTYMIDSSLSDREGLTFFHRTTDLEPDIISGTDYPAENLYLHNSFPEESYYDYLKSTPGTRLLDTLTIANSGAGRTRITSIESDSNHSFFHLNGNPVSLPYYIDSGSTLKLLMQNVSSKSREIQHGYFKAGHGTDQPDVLDSWQTTIAVGPIIDSLSHQIVSPGDTLKIFGRRFYGEKKDYVLNLGGIYTKPLTQDSGLISCIVPRLMNYGFVQVIDSTAQLQAMSPSKLQAGFAGDTFHFSRTIISRKKFGFNPRYTFQNGLLSGNLFDHKTYMAGALYYHNVAWTSLYLHTVKLGFKDSWAVNTHTIGTYNPFADNTLYDINCDGFADNHAFVGWSGGPYQYFVRFKNIRGKEYPGLEFYSRYDVTIKGISDPVLHTFDHSGISGLMIVGDTTGVDYCKYSTAYKKFKTNGTANWINSGFIPQPRTTGKLNKCYTFNLNDFNADGKVDMLVGEYKVGLLKILYNTSDETTRFDSLSIYSNRGDGVVHSTADLNGDKIPDLILQRIQNYDSMDLIQGKIVNGKYVMVAKGRPWPVMGKKNRWIIVRDFNGDKKPDLFIFSTNPYVSNKQSKVYFLRNVSTPTDVRFRLDDSLFLGVREMTAVNAVNLDYDDQMEILITWKNDTTEVFKINHRLLYLTNSSYTYSSVWKDSLQTINTNLLSNGAVGDQIDSISLPSGYTLKINGSSGYSFPLQVKAMDTLKLNITFKKTKIGPFADSIIFYSRSFRPRPVCLFKGLTKALPFADISPNFLRFDTLYPYANIKSSRFIKVRNIGDDTLKISKIVLSDTVNFKLKYWPKYVLPKDSNIVELTFKPSDIGPYTGSATIYHNSKSLTYTTNLAGYGIGAVLNDVQTVMKSSFHFLDSAKARYLIINTGNVTATIDSIREPVNFYSMKWTGSKLQIKPKDTLKVDILLRNVVPGNYKDSIQIYYQKSTKYSNAKIVMDHTVLTGNIVHPGVVAFGQIKIGTSPVKRINISNNGAFSTKIIKTTIVPALGNVTVTYQATTIAAGASRWMDITVKGISTGPFDYLCIIESNNYRNPDTLRLTGQVISGILVCPDSIFYGNRRINKTVYKNLKIYNNGDDILNLTSFSTSSDGLIKATIPASFQLVNGDSLGIPTSYNPKIVNKLSTTKLALVRSDIKDTQYIYISGTGAIGRFAPLLDISCGEITANKTYTHKFFVKNIGNDTSNISSVKALSSTITQISPTSITIAPADSVWFSVTHNHLDTGVFADNIEITSNNARTKDTLKLYGNVSNSTIKKPGDISFGMCRKNRNHQRNIDIANEGNDTGFVSIALSSNTTAFSIGGMSFIKIPPAQVFSLPVVYNPQFIGSADSLRILFTDTAANKQYTCVARGMGGGDSVVLSQVPPDSVKRGKNYPRKFFVQNLGNLPAVADTITIQGSGMHSILYFPTKVISADSVIMASVYNDTIKQQADTLYYFFADTCNTTVLSLVSKHTVLFPKIQLKYDLHFKAKKDSSSMDSVVVMNTGSDSLFLLYANYNTRFTLGQSSASIAAGDEQIIEIHYLNTDDQICQDSLFINAPEPWLDRIVYLTGMSDTSGSTGGLKQIEHQPKIRVIPNPFMTEFEIQTKNALLKIELCDISGRNIPFEFRKSANGYSVSSPSALDGIYTLKVQTIYGTEVIRLLRSGN